MTIIGAVLLGRRLRTGDREYQAFLCGVSGVDKLAYASISPAIHWLTSYSSIRQTI